jgi:hypothetical protein
VSSARISTQTTIGTSLKAGDKQVAVVTKSHRFRLFSFPFLVRWDRPAGILVQDADGSESMMPIIDLTRVIQISIFFLAFLVLFALSRTFNTRTDRV